ncbi:hypothetical protein GYMLUDRAFT_59251 [Collybiopsis luxurians FD-317 M1]|uniref:Uncharacterized protein n=1 Tax=Collybiopsis luxurians FD-317 M1 TaxID=944289 RepID=A0A0D0CEA0_9AGAR|nr:hypothetical protein GYMLUDRAFT_59251 [Collybiopsis luxurians FD-317 M1]
MGVRGTMYWRTISTVIGMNTVQPWGRNHIQHLRQSNTILGLGSKQFDKDVNAIINIYAELAGQVGKIECFQIKEVEGRRMLEIGNRIFMLKREAPNMEWFVPLCEVNSESTIESQNTEQSTFTHNIENVVHFEEEKSEGEGEKMYKRAYQMNINDTRKQDIYNEPTQDPCWGHCHCGIPAGYNSYKARIKGDFNTESGDAVGQNTHSVAQNKSKVSIKVQLKKRSAFNDEAEKDVEDAGRELKKMVESNKAKMVE